MQKLLIAIRAQSMADALESALSSRFKIHRCGTDADMCSMINRLRPDALIIDLRLINCDLSLLENFRCRPAAVLALTDLINSEIVQRAAGVGVGALVIVPCSSKHVAEVLARLITKIPSPEG